MGPDSNRSRLSAGWPVVLVVVAGIVLSAISATLLARGEQDSFDDRFRADSERARVLIQAQVDRVTGVHEVLRDAVTAGWPVDRAEFERLVANRSGRPLFSSVQAVSFNRRVPAAGRADYEAGVRDDRSLDPVGYPDFEVRPETSTHDDLLVVEYLEPFVANDSAFGFDIGSNPARRAAVEEARDSGDLVATEPVSLVQEERGVLLIGAVYDVADDLVSEPSRRRHFVGVVVTVVRLDELLAEALGAEPRVDLEIYDQGRTVDRVDGATFGEEQLVFDPDGARFVGPAGDVDGVSQRLDLNVGGRRWSLIARPIDGLGVPSAIWGVLAAGLAVTAALAVTMWAVTGARARAESLVRRRTADLYALLDFAPDPTVVVGDDHRIVLASRRIRELLGHEPDDLTGERLWAILPDLDVPAPGAESATTLDLEAVHRDGHRVPVDVSSGRLPEGGLGTAVVALRDASVRRAALAELERASELKTAFLATVSHELRTPLTAIAGFSQLLGQDVVDAEARREYVHRITRNVRNLQVLIAEILDFTELERSATQLRPQDFDLADAAREVVAELGGVLATHEVEVHGSGVPVHADRGVFGRVLANLLTNAVRYSPPGGEVAIRCELTDGGAILHVDDDGPGIPPAERDKVFERFWRGRAAVESQVAGSGIGLAVVAELVELSGGAASVADSPLGGARITLALPARPADVPAPGQERSTDTLPTP